MCVLVFKLLKEKRDHLKIIPDTGTIIFYVFSTFPMNIFKSSKYDVFFFRGVFFCWGISSKPRALGE